jgi:hypothetical protein
MGGLQEHIHQPATARRVALVDDFESLHGDIVHGNRSSISHL